MSNFLAVATVTAAIQRLLGQAAADDVPGATVSTDRPDTKKSQSAPQTNVYLYHVSPNPAARNVDLPTRNAAGNLVQRPQAALDLHYLLTFYGDDKELEPARLLGSAVRTLHTHPVLSPDLIEAVVADANAQPAVHPSLVTTDLASAFDPVRICPLPLDLEQLSKLWSVFFQTPYALSTAWMASVVLVEDEAQVTTGPPVTTPVLSVFPLPKPTIDAVVVTGDQFAPITADRTVVVKGTQLQGDRTTVRLAGVDLAPTTTSATSLTVDLASAPAGELRAGTVGVQVVLAKLVGAPPEPRGEVQSGVFSVTLHPRVVSASVAAVTIRVTSDLTVGAKQRAAIQLLDTTTGASVAVLLAVDRSDDATTVQANATGVSNGTYGVVLLIDGAASQVERSNTGAITAPIVTVS